jgi:hypothetical protein
MSSMVYTEHMSDKRYASLKASEVTVGTLAYPRGEVTKVVADSPAPGWTTIEVIGGDRWDWQATDVLQFSPRKSFRARV